MSSYTKIEFTQHINQKIDIVIECGSRDCNDAIEMLNYYKPSKIYSFECNPESIPVCRENIKNIPEIELIEFAVSDSCGFIDFYATDMEKSFDKNIGASSALCYRNQTQYIQKKISVPATTLKQFVKDKNISNIDLLCLDLQGYEKIALDGLGEDIQKVKYIISEITFDSFYHNDILFDEYKTFLEKKQFQFIEKVSYDKFGDALFKNLN